MEFFFFWLLLPVAAVSGWYLARKDCLKKTVRATYELPSEYFRGVNYILNHQPDKAIDLFLKLSEIDKDTAEVHLALGSLFRQRGEVDRAIRVHQSLINRSGLSAGLHCQAMRSLAQDYMSAGLLDRAESLCLELHDTSPSDISALKLLMDIYQQEKEWFRAIDVARKIEQLESASQATVIAHYYCELVEIGLQRDDFAQALRMLEKALAEDPDCGRAMIIGGQMAYREKNYDAAIVNFHKLEHKNPEYFGEVLQQLYACYEALGKTERLVSYLKGVISTTHSVDLLLTATRILCSHNGKEVALSFLAGELMQAPSLRGIQYMLELNLPERDDAKGYFSVVKSSLDKLLENKPVYKCRQCGFTGVEMHWCCPSCKTWASVKPIQEFQWGASI